MKRIIRLRAIALAGLAALALAVSGCAAGTSGTATTPAGTTAAGSTAPTATGGTTVVDYKWETIRAKEAKARMDAETGYLLVDVRTPEEFASSHIPGAENIEYTGIVEALAARGVPKDQRIYLYCRSGNRSSIAAGTLAKAGYTAVTDFGGIIDWPYATAQG
ncbi:MAG: rhodanese-like domain-containing protein [Clostridia bacterium]|nr:rhodanese-like domain-containing protein [Clostridia bacterium]